MERGHGFRLSEQREENIREYVENAFCPYASGRAGCPFSGNNVPLQVHKPLIHIQNLKTRAKKGKRSDKPLKQINGIIDAIRSVKVKCKILT